MSPPITCHKPRARRRRGRSSAEILSLHPYDNHTIRLLAAHHGLTIRDTVHQIVTHYLSTHDIDLGKIFSDPKSILGNHIE